MTAGSPDMVMTRREWLGLASAWLLSLVATLGALFVGEVMGQAPCLLCWYQRIAMFPLTVILAVACLTEDPAGRRYALPLAVIGAAIALWHSLLYLGIVPQGIEPCTQGVSCSGAGMTVLGGVPLPLLSLAAFAAIVLLMVTSRGGRKG